MRTLLIAIMIALLPVRGFVGDAMAMQMVQQGLEAASPMDTDSASAAMEPGACPDHLSAAIEGGHASHGGVCHACDVCHQATLASRVSPPAPLVRPGFAPALAVQAFASADTAGSFKPPIL
jgi:hypothetical protein